MLLCKSDQLSRGPLEYSCFFGGPLVTLGAATSSGHHFYFCYITRSAPRCHDALKVLIPLQLTSGLSYLARLITNYSF